MIPSGIILAALDCDLDSIEDWNRWYDLEHTPPNVALAGVVLSRRYVAPPELHKIRWALPGHAMADKRTSFITIYTLCGPPAETVAAMAVMREKLYADGRMNFPPEKKAVRAAGGAMSYVAGRSTTDRPLEREEVPFVGHTAILIVMRKGAPAVSAWYEDEWSKAVVAVPGVHGVATYQADGRDDQVDIVYLEGDPSAVTAAIRAAAPHHVEATIFAEAPFITIQNFEYPWAERMRASDLPRTVAL